MSKGDARRQYPCKCAAAWELPPQRPAARLAKRRPVANQRPPCTRHPTPGGPRSSAQPREGSWGHDLGRDMRDSNGDQRPVDSARRVPDDHDGRHAHAQRQHRRADAPPILRPISTARSTVRRRHVAPFAEELPIDEKLSLAKVAERDPATPAPRLVGGARPAADVLHLGGPVASSKGDAVRLIVPPRRKARIRKAPAPP
jgi:hypothetical protein